MNITREEKAIHSFRSGLNCAQSVLGVFADDYGFDSGLALRISSGFGAGMGRLQETCGAVTGAFMLFGIHCCNKYTDNTERKDKLYSMIQLFSDRFKAMHGTTNCKDLTQCDLSTDAGQQYFKENDLMEKVCEKCVLNSLKIIDDLCKESEVS